MTGPTSPARGATEPGWNAGSVVARRQNAELGRDGARRTKSVPVTIDGETADARRNRQLTELLNELRVALPGVQMLFGFLLAVPFTQRFTHVTSNQQGLYYAAFTAAAGASVCFIAPTAFHRIVWQHGDKALLVRISSVLTIVGTVFLAVAIASVMLFITSYLYGSSYAAVAGSVLLAMLVALWYLVPLAVRLRLVDGGSSRRRNRASPSGPGCGACGSCDAFVARRSIESAGRSRRPGWSVPVVARAELPDLGRQVLIGGDELVPPRLHVAAFTPGEVIGEMFDMDLHPGPIGGEQVEGQAALLDDQDRLVAGGGQRHLDDGLVRLTRVRVGVAHHKQQPLAAARRRSRAPCPPTRRRGNVRGSHRGGAGRPRPRRSSG